MLNKNKPVILYFVAGVVPTIQEKEDAATLGRVRFRNVTRIDPGGALEACDFVAGIVPQPYEDIPRAQPLPDDEREEDPQAPVPDPMTQTPGMGPSQKPVRGKSGKVKSDAPKKASGWSTA